MSRSKGGLIEIGGEPHVTAAVTDDDGDRVWVSTSVYTFASEEERMTIAEAQHLYPAPYDHNMTEMGTLVL